MKKILSLILGLVLACGLQAQVANTGHAASVGSTAPDAGGDVVGPASSTNNAFARFSGTTGKLLQDTPDLTYSSPTMSVPDLFTVSSAGSIGLTAGGSNQNVTITPSGTGKAIIVGSINVSGGTSITSYANFNSGALSSTTSLNPGVLIYSGASSTSQYGMDLGYSGGYRLRLMAPNVISLALVTGAPPTTQSDFSEKFIFDLQNNIATISSIQSSGSSVIFTSPLTIAKASTGMQSSFSDYFGGYRATIQFKNPLDASIAGRGSGFGYVDNSGITRSLFATYTNDTSGTNFSSSFFVTGSDGTQRLTWSADGEGTNGLTLYGPKSGPVQVISTSVFKVNSTTDSTTAGAGSISTLGGVYATKKIISGTSVFDGTTASLAITGGAGNMTITAGTGNSRTLTLQTTTSGGTATDALVIGATQTLTKLNGLTTAGLGAPTIVAQANITAQSAAATITSYANPATDADFEISCQLNVSAATSLSAPFQCTYTDVNNVAKTLTFAVQDVDGTGGTYLVNGLMVAAAAKTFMTPVMHIRVKASTTITLKTGTGTYTGVTYSASGLIRKLD